MKKASRSRKPELVLAYDLGGTKVAVGIVDSKGKVLAETREPVRIAEGKQALIRQLADTGKRLMKEHPGVKRVGFASAGPLDPAGGALLDPTNFVTNGKTWGRFPIASLLSKALKMPVILENDAAAAMLAEYWIGAAKGHQNAMILTLGTGLGTGVVCNGELVRAGQGLHPEAGHIVLNFEDKSAPCGCGNLGCSEAYLSGVNFTRRAHAKLGDSKLTTQEIADLARGGYKRALALFDEYALLMALAIQNYVVIYAPEIVVFTGSFANTSDLFLKKTREHLERLLVRRRKGVDMMPKLALSKLDNRAGLIGGAYVAMHLTRGGLTGQVMRRSFESS